MLLLEWNGRTQAEMDETRRQFWKNVLHHLRYGTKAVMLNGPRTGQVVYVKFPNAKAMP